MTTVVKEIIEYCIDVIEQKDWHEFFTIYRTEFANHDHQVDQQILNDLYNTLAEVGINLEEESIEARKDIIFQDYYNIVEDAFNKRYTHARFTYGTRQLRSRLGFGLSELKDIWVEVGKAIGKSMDGLTIWNKE